MKEECKRGDSRREEGEGEGERVTEGGAKKACVRWCYRRITHSTLSIKLEEGEEREIERGRMREREGGRGEGRKSTH